MTLLSDTPLIATGMCLRPMEVASSSDGKINENGTLNLKVGPGCSVLLTGFVSVEGYLVPLELLIDFTKDMATAVRDALTEYLEDGHHMHVHWDGQMEREADHGIEGVTEETEFSFEVPDTVEGLGINVPPEVAE